MVNDGNATATEDDIRKLNDLFNTFLFEILGMRPDIISGESATQLKPFEEAVDLLLSIRAESKAKKDWATSDLIRNRLTEIGFNIKDTKDGFEWSLK